MNEEEQRAQEKLWVESLQSFMEEHGGFALWRRLGWSVEPDSLKADFGRGTATIGLRNGRNVHYLTINSIGEVFFAPVTMTCF